MNEATLGSTDNVAVLTVVGFAMQYLRGYRWFTDGASLLFALIFALMMSWLEHEQQAPRELIIRGFELVPPVLGGTFLAHLASQQTCWVPRWNSFSKPKEGNQ
jgi:hypothetical protein